MGRWLCKDRRGLLWGIIIFSTDWVLGVYHGRCWRGLLFLLVRECRSLIEGLKFEHLNSAGLLTGSPDLRMQSFSHVQKRKSGSRSQDTGGLHVWSSAVRQKGNQYGEPRQKGKKATNMANHVRNE